MLLRATILILTALSLISGLGAPLPAIDTQSNAQLDVAVDFFPVAPYHSGDVLSARLTYTGDTEVSNWEVSVAWADSPDEVLASTTFSQHSRQAIFYWFLDTQEIDPGFLTFEFTIPEIDYSWTTGLHLLPDPGNRHAQWQVAHSPCCTLHYLSGTDAQTDQAEIMAALEKRSALALDQFAQAGVLDENPITEPLPIVLIPVVVGHGGFATDEAVLTYTHYNWAGIDFEILAHHEMVHVIDRLINTQGPRPALFVEGLAVYLSGGHYREGDPLQRAAALLALDLYLPITEIVNDFYAAQHEIGYMQAAALLAYMDLRWGWETLIDFYFNLPEGASDDEIISTALETRFGLSLAELEADLIAYLASLPADPAVEADVRLTIETYDTLRRYQTLLIPSAHFRSAWWPHPRQMRLTGIVGDYAYREKAPVNVLIEKHLIAVHADLASGDYARAEATLAQINTLLSRIEATGGRRAHYALGWPLPARPLHSPAR